jgi:hypothetical protein
MKYIFPALFTLVFITACNDPEIIEKSDLFGSVILYDEGTTKIPTKEGMRVTLQGSLKDTLQTTTDEEGKFRFSNVDADLYRLIFEKDNFGKHTVENFLHKGQPLGTPLDPIPSLGQKSSTEVVSIEAIVNTNRVFILAGTNQAASINNPKYLRFFFSTSPALTNREYTKATETYVAKIDPFELTLTKDQLLNMEFDSGQRVYVRCYGDSFWSNAYTDSETGTKIFSNLNPISAAATSFLVP